MRRRRRRRRGRGRGGGGGSNRRRRGGRRGGGGRRSSSAGGKSAAELAFLVANRAPLTASAFANPSRAAVSKNLGGVRAPDRPTFSTAMKAATVGGGLNNPLGRKKARDQLLTIAAAGKLATVDVSHIGGGKTRKIKGSKSIRKNPKVRTDTVVITGSFHPPAHRVESDRKTVVARLKADRLEERRVRRLLGLEKGKVSRKALKASLISDAAEYKVLHGAPPLLFPSHGDDGGFGGGGLILGSPTRPLLSVGPGDMNTFGASGGDGNRRLARRSLLAGEGGEGGGGGGGGTSSFSVAAAAIDSFPSSSAVRAAEAAAAAGAASLPPAVSGTVKPLRVGTEEGMLPSPRGAGAGAGASSGSSAVTKKKTQNQKMKKNALLSGRAARLLAGHSLGGEPDDETRGYVRAEQVEGYSAGDQSEEEWEEDSGDDEDAWDPDSVTHTYTSSGLL